VSIDTIRYYDKIDLFKPIYVDPHSGYRYYSIIQYEELGTILELRNIGLSVDFIKDYMTNRNAEKSIAILKKQQTKLEAEREILNEKVNTLQNRIQQIEIFQTQYEKNNFLIKKLQNRTFKKFKHPISFYNDILLSHSILTLEKNLSEVIPLLANQRIGHVITLNSKIIQNPNLNSGDISQYWQTVELFMLLEGVNHSVLEFETIESGTYACTTYSGLNSNSAIQATLRLIQHCHANNLKIVSDKIWNIIKIDTSITNIKEESIYEVQVKVESYS
jgi:DNA-binding transcriptional MerR regulator